MAFEFISSEQKLFLLGKKNSSLLIWIQIYIEFYFQDKMLGYHHLDMWLSNALSIPIGFAVSMEIIK